MCRKVRTLFLLAAIGLYVAFTVELAAAAEVALQWEKVLGAAKKEGQLVLAANPTTQAVFAEFQKKYPEIKVVAAPGRGDPTQIIAERRAEKYVVDLIIRGMTDMSPLYKARALDPIKTTLMLPEVLDESKWWGGKHLYKDKEKQYILATDLTVLTSFAYNTKLVDPKEIKSYWDFINPKWKGKILLLEPASGGTGTSLQFLYYHNELGPEFIRRFLTEMDITASRDTHQIVDWLATGKFAISGLTLVNRTGLDLAKKQELPVNWFSPQQFKEGMALVSTAHTGLMNRAPHPNAARVAINWYLSREGQMTRQKPGNVDSLRIDIPKDDVGSHARRIEGVKYLVLDDQIDTAPITKFVKEVWNRKN